MCLLQGCADHRCTLLRQCMRASKAGRHHVGRCSLCLTGCSCLSPLCWLVGAGLALMGVAVLGFLGLAGSKGCLGRIALRLYVTILFVLMIVFFAAGGAIVYATKFLVRNPLPAGAGRRERVTGVGAGVGWESDE